MAKVLLLEGYVSNFTYASYSLLYVEFNEHVLWVAFFILWSSLSLVNTPIYILFYCHGNFSGMNPQKTHFTDSNESVKLQFWRACTKKSIYALPNLK
jgi:hypothetical protein